jgi:branched-chain amino acid aminotransferase
MSATSPIAYYNGEYRSEDAIAISPNDRGLLYGDGVFDTLRAAKQSIVSFHEHFERLKDNCQRVSIPLNYSPAEIRHILGELLNRNAISDAYIRITITRGIGEQFGFGFSKNIKPNFLTVVRPRKDIPEALYQKGVRIAFQQTNLFNRSEGRGIKSLSAQKYVLPKQEALNNNCYEMILTDFFDTVYEGTSSNIFIVKNNTVVTAPVTAGVLPGITRERVIYLLNNRLSIPIAQKTFSKNEVLEADEVFLTNTNIEILPVTQADEKLIGTGKIGNVTQHILDSFRQTLIEILE